jgi:hypothetical protein
MFSLFHKEIDKTSKLKFIDDVDLNLFNYLTNDQFNIEDVHYLLFQYYIN